MFSFAKTLEKLVKIKSLTLEFFKCTEITNKGITKITKELTKMTSLENLVIDLFGTESISNSSLEPLCNFIANSKNLKTI